MLKPVFSHLRQRGRVSSGYIDDTFLEGDSYNLCKENVIATMQLFRGLGFWPHDLKSVTEPTQILEHLGFVLNSQTMTVSLSDEKFDKLYQLAQRILELEKVSIRLVASLIGIMVSFCPGLEYGQLYYRQIEIEKTIALKRARGDCDQNMILSHKAKNDIKWWLAHAKNSKRKISHGNATIILYTDASNQGWGATTTQENTGGRWSPEEQLIHINAKELLAIQFGL